MFKVEPLRVIGLDIETERKGSDWGTGTWKFKSMFCADMRFRDEDKHRFLNFRPTTKAFSKWLEPLRLPDILVVAHNASYDLDGINGWAIKQGLPPLPPLLVHDTCRHGYKNGGMYSKSLRYLCHEYNVKVKGGIDAWEWEQAYAGDIGTLLLVKEYNQQDVDCVLELREAMLTSGHLKPPRLWRP